MNRTLAAWTFALGFLAVAIGAFGAHGLKPHMDAYEQSIFETASRYHFYHAIALLLLAFFQKTSWTKYSGWCFIIGIALFSGSLYLLSLKNLLEIAHWKFLGPITPIGGLFLLAGWAIGFMGVLRR